MDILPVSLRIRILNFRRWRYRPNWGGSGISDPFNRLYWPESGRGLVKHGRGNVELRPGRVYLFPANQSADYSCSEPIKLAWIHFNAEIFSGAMDLTHIVEMPLALTPADPVLMARIWDRFMVESAPEDFPAGVERDGIVRMILACFLRSSGEVEALLTRRLRQFGRFRSALTYIDAHLHEPVTLAGLAQTMHLQPNYFSNLFCRHFGMPPMRYVQRRRIERAQVRLYDSSASISEIAAELGFCDQFHFSRVFRSIAGCAPRDYRQQKPEPVAG